ncbi:hypothetical protein SAMN05892883_1337 [Jatrophihabitans sp. GAS493]|uniref:DUF1254 domain-containing protein n=1 Tax=Jatrophihabitans sp. GAS493 TaxID=1907575 RepID=UPI000BB6AC73|nr:DUF1254 domain-containing protein [Jatrophihabitans sp. GAS493]SOD71876.1 hypothetical protein SAMN05892883_1337 [Jatrophihabitans sp. GAS493]
MTDTDELAAEAYLYYYPLVENLRQVVRYVTTGVGSNPPRDFNTFSHARKLAGPQDTFVTINNDTLYSIAQLDLSGGPVLVEVPDTGDRYYVLQFVDAWSNNIAYIGTRSTGSGTGRFVVVPPRGADGLPDGYTAVTASTNIVSIVGRFACAGPDDVKAANAAQDALVLRPLVEAASYIGIPSVGDGLSHELRFWEQARVWSQTFPAPAGDDEFTDKYRPLGIVEGESPYLEPGEFTDAMSAGYRSGIEKLEYLTHHGSSPVNNGWTVGMHMFDYSVYNLGLGTRDEVEWKIGDPARRIVERAVADRLGLWGNHGYEAVYAQAFTDISGAPLVGEKTYAATFDEPPPVGAFWSITLYNIPQYYLVENAIDRYSIGDRTPGIRYDADGSLTITFSHTEPTDPTSRANWLPTPSGPFRLVLRLYIPGDPVLDGTYQLPAITEGVGHR